MKSFNTYLNFDGNTREAMTFYQQCVNGELVIQTFADAKMDAPPGAENRVIHARLTAGTQMLMASDIMPGMPFMRGNNFSVIIECDTIEETDTLFAAFGEGGRVTMALQNTFWGARFGMLTDKFGIQWMFNCQLPKS